MSRFPVPQSAAGTAASPGVSWSVQGSAFLDSYLVQEVENPGINPQSVMVRAFLADYLAPEQHDRLIEDELGYAAAAAYALLGWREGWFPELCRNVWTDGASAELPAFMRIHASADQQSFSLRELFNDLSRCLLIGFEGWRSPFADRWQAALPPPRTVRPNVLEAACGSANDYRYWEHYGFAARLDYTGIDLCPENIANALARYPGARFLTGDVCAMPFADEEFDIVCASDLLEHLSEEGIGRALQEMVRVTRDEIWLSFFNLAGIPAHEYRTDDDSYFCNLLSAPEICAALESLGCTAELICVADEFSGRFPGYRHYNPEAHIVIARRMPSL